ncbi:hypothetical protein MAJ_11358, partial [Metarhizium majus ARSEF 297]
MARPHNQKRQRANEPSQTDTDPPAKKIKTRSEIELEAWRSWKYPPEFWDRLSKIELTHRALEELDRRTRTRRSHPLTPARHSGLVPTTSKDLDRFARHGGPDLRDLRGHPNPTTRMSSSRSSRSRRTKSALPTSTLPTSATSKTKTQKSSPYNRGFELHLTEHAIHPTWRSQKPDLEEVKETLAVPRLSLSPSKFSEGAFNAFQESNARAKDEDDVKADVIPTITGPTQSDYLVARNTVFGNLEPLTDNTLAPANPDLYYGAYPQDLNRSIRAELASHIIPSTMEDKPMAPNFFLEVKGPDGSAAVATRQARYDGAIASRGIHSLQNYGEEEPQYDGQAYTYSSIYHDGTLKLYTHHITAPTTPGARPEYHMTQIKGYAMTSDRETFVQGATAFRNARDLAKRHRDRFIQAANARAPPQVSASGMAAHEDPFLAYNESQEFVDSPDYTTLHDADDALQQHIADASNYALEDDGEVISFPYAEDDSQEPSGESVVPGLEDSSVVSSFTSSFSPTKRPRLSASPPSSRDGQPSKNRMPPNSARRAAKSA